MTCNIPLSNCVYQQRESMYCMCVEHMSLCVWEGGGWRVVGSAEGKALKHRRWMMVRG